MEKCIIEKVVPAFTRVKTEVMNKARLSKNQVRSLRFRKLNSTISSVKKAQQKHIKKFDESLSLLLSSNDTILNQFSNNIENLKKTIFVRANYLESHNQTQKNIKFDKLIRSKISSRSDKRVKIQIFNDTNIQIPDAVLEALSHGFEIATGGVPNKIRILTSFDKFFEKWKKYAEKIGLDAFEILEIRAKLFVNFGDLVRYKFNCPKREILNNFFENQPNLLIIPSDKNKSVTITDKIKYCEKLNTVLDGDEFEKLDSDPYEETAQSLKDSLVGFVNYFDQKTLFKMKPQAANKRMYGLYKTHKPSVPIRPIISSLHTVCSGSEEVILSIIKQFKYSSRSILNTKEFKQNFLQVQEKFDKDKHDILSFDAVSLFTNVNTELVVEYICEKIYKTPTKYFKNFCVKNENNRYKIPPKSLFQKFFNDLLTNFSCFDSHSGFYRQKHGISMGSKISPFLANVFCHMMEVDKILPFEKTGEILKYVRYVDDVFIFCEKKSTEKILKKMNSFHEQLKFTKKIIENNSLQFLDCLIYIDEKNIPQFKTYHKEGSELTIDYKYSISPINQKISVLCGEIYRANDSNSNVPDLHNALEYIKIKYKNLNFPENLVKNKINEIVARKFVPKNNKTERLQDILDNPDRNCNLILTFNHPKCEKVGKRIYNLIRSATPEFRLNIIWKTVRLSQILSPKLKAQVVDSKKNNLVYSFLCPCSISYFGETARRLRTRVQEHQQTKKGTAISKHILTCDIYKSELKKFAGDKPTPSQRINFHLSRFKPIATNLPFSDERKRFEAIAIKIFNPLLNKQIDRKAVSII